VTVYLDASVLVALANVDSLTGRAAAFFRANTPLTLRQPFASAVARCVRTGDITSNEALRGFSAFDMWTATATQREETMAADVRAARTFLRRLDLSLRTTNALDIATALTDLYSACHLRPKNGGERAGADGNNVELNINNRGNEWTATGHMKAAPSERANLVFVDPDKMIAARKAGASPWEVHERRCRGVRSDNAVRAAQLF
jgi:hypothetical protein